MIPLAAEKKHYATKIVNGYIFYDLDFWMRNSSVNFKFKNWLFGATIIPKKIQMKKSMNIVAMEYHFTVQIHGVLLMALLEIF